MTPPHSQPHSQPVTTITSDNQQQQPQEQEQEQEEEEEEEEQQQQPSDSIFFRFHSIQGLFHSILKFGSSIHQVTDLSFSGLDHWINGRKPKIGRASESHILSAPKLNLKIWGVPKMEVPNNHGFSYQKWSFWGVLGVPQFKETPIWLPTTSNKKKFSET